MKEGIIDILGGMGPAATAGLFQKIIKTTRAAREGHTDIVRLLREAGAKE